MSSLTSSVSVYNEYLFLLKIHNIQPPTFEFLKILYQSHLETFAYTNLDFMLNRTVSLKIENIVLKFLNEYRGGVCYELTYSFFCLLRFLGYKAKAIYANLESIGGMVFNPSETAHAVIIVFIDDNTYLLDVGFGDTFRRPINLDGGMIKGKKKCYRIIKEPNSKHPYILQKLRNSRFIKLYSFSLDHVFIPPKFMNNSTCTKEKFPNFHDNFVYLLPNKLGSDHIINNVLIREKMMKQKIIKITNVKSLKLLLIKKMHANSSFIENIPNSKFANIISFDAK